MSRIPITILGVATMLASAPTSATVLVAGSGWQSDSIAKIGQVSNNSAWTFTIGAAGTLSFVDRFAAGDRYTITGDINGVTNFDVGSASDIQAGGLYGSLWTNPAYSRATFVVGPGTYSFSIVGDLVRFAPSGFGLRLDLSSPVPEPASWALLIGGFALVGAAMRRRPRLTIIYT